ncbi:MAG: PIN domain-containing protein [Steroidobacteraceae bacterium]
MSDAEPFFDTSVLLYLLSAEVEKADRVEKLLEQSGVISVQVLNEFTAVATRKLGLSLAEVREVLGVVRTVCVTHPLTVEHYDRGVAIVERYRFSFYDSVIIASALLAGCKTLYSADLQHRQIVDKQLTVINPFSKSRS